jgi:hypothetical protein
MSVLDFQAQGKYQVLGRNLETAVFQDVVISDEACGALFRHMHKLKVLHVEYNMKDEIGYGYLFSSIFLYMLIHRVISYDWEPEVCILTTKLKRIWPELAFYTRVETGYLLMDKFRNFCPA